MQPLDYLVLCGTLAAIVGWGLYKEHGARTTRDYLRAGDRLRFWTIGLSIMATQASAITFLSMPGQAYVDGMGFLQFYFGLPIAMVLLSVLVVPIYYRLKVYTAYEYLESRFDRKTRQLTALLFLLSRGLSAGVSIYAPAIVLSTVLGWPLQTTVLVIGVVTIAYTVTGGTRIVSRTQTYQMVIMLGGMVAAAVVIWHELPAELSFGRLLQLAGALGHTQVVDTSWRFDTRYTLWSGLLGGLFVALAYFGTDQSQVQRYLGGRSVTESRLGLLMNGLIKIPMQALILFIGVLIFVFYLFHEPPVSFDRTAWNATLQGRRASEAEALAVQHSGDFSARESQSRALLAALAQGDRARVESQTAQLREAARLSVRDHQRAAELIAQSGVKTTATDADYIFIDFVVTHFPRGFVGLIVAVILCAAMSAVSAALISLGSTSVVDFYRPYLETRRGKAGESAQAADAHYVKAAKWFTVLWGAIAVAFAVLTSQRDNLIQAVNILGSLFYGPMLGVFVTGFFLRWIKGHAVFFATLAAESAVLTVAASTSIGFLWYNVIGCAVVLGVGALLQIFGSP